MTQPKTGTLFGVGLGPGDPELITLKALRLIRAADLLAYPAPLGADSFARRIVAEFLTGDQAEYRIDVPMAPAIDAALPAYDQAAETLGRALHDGRDVAVLCQGDPFFYGSFMYLFDRLSRDHKVEIVPGVSSIMAAAAASHMPIVSRDQTLNIVPATLPEVELATRLAGADAVAILKLGRHFTKVRYVLGELGLAGRARYVEHASLPSQRCLPLEAVDPARVPYFSMILIGGEGRERKVSLSHD